MLPPIVSWHHYSLHPTFTVPHDHVINALKGGSGDDVGAADGGPQRPYGFAPARDFTRLPRAVPLNTSSRFMGHLDVLYSSVYHHLGGEVVVGDATHPPDSTAPTLGNTLRSLFLWSDTDARTGVCTAPRFASELDLTLGDKCDDLHRTLLDLKETVLSTDGNACMHTCSRCHLSCWESKCCDEVVL